MNRLILIILALLLANNVFALETKEICGDPIPQGWVLTNRYHDLGKCNTPYPPTPLQANVSVITRWDNLPVGTVLDTCNQSPPSGWSAEPSRYDGSICGCPWPGGCTALSPNVVRMTHVQCVSQSQGTCYGTGWVTASPNPVTIPYGQTKGASQVSYGTSGTLNGAACLWVSQNGAAPTPQSCGGASGTVSWPNVPVGGTSRFIIAPSGSSPSPELASVTIKGIAAAQPSLSASPNPVIVPYGQANAATTLTWNAPGYTGACVWISNNGGTPSPMSCGGAASSGSVLWPYIPSSGNTKFFLAPSNTNPSVSTLATLTVNGIPGAQPTMKLVPKYNLVETSPTSGNVLIPATASPTQGPFTFTWNAPGYPSVDLQGQTNGGPWLEPFNITASGTTDQPMPLGTTYNYRLLPHGATSPVLATLSVSGIAAPAPTFSTVPSQVIVPVGSTAGSFTLKWNAPGYEMLDMTGQTNGGAWSAPFGIGPSGTSVQPISVGTTYNYRFYPRGDTVHIIGTATVRASR